MKRSLCLVQTVSHDTIKVVAPEVNFKEQTAHMPLLFE